MTDLADLIKGLGKSIAVSSFLPVTLFLVACAILLTPVVPKFLCDILVVWFPSFTQIGIVFLLLSSFLGFALFSLSDTVYKMFEGQYFPLRLRAKLHEKRRGTLIDELKPLVEEKKELERLPAVDMNSNNVQRLQYLRSTILLRQAQLEESYPLPPEPVASTDFGNVTRAYGAYLARRYGINMRVCWPRFLHVIPASTYDTIEEKNNFVRFLLNSSLLLGILTVLAVLIALYEVFTVLIFERIPEIADQSLAQYLSLNYNLQKCLLFYFFTAFVSSLVAYGLYRSAIPLEQTKGRLVCASFELFRCKLLDQLRFPLPLDIDQERYLWGDLEDFWLAGPLMKSVASHTPWFVYQHPDAKKKTLNVILSVPEENPEQYSGSKPKPQEGESN